MYGVPLVLRHAYPPKEGPPMMGFRASSEPGQFSSGHLLSESTVSGCSPFWSDVPKLPHKGTDATMLRVSETW